MQMVRVFLQLIQKPPIYGHLSTRRAFIWLVSNRLNELDTALCLQSIFYRLFALGFGASLWGDAISLGAVVETERQVEAHLADQQDLF